MGPWFDSFFFFFWKGGHEFLWFLLICVEVRCVGGGGRESCKVNVVERFVCVWALTNGLF